MIVFENPAVDSQMVPSAAPAENKCHVEIFVKFLTMFDVRRIREFLMTLMDRLGRLGRRRGLQLRYDDVSRIVERNEAQSWFLYAFKSRRRRWDLWRTAYWLEDHLPRDARIMETGCGCGLNLIWLGQRGFERLYGFDNDPKAIAAAQELAELASVSVDSWVDDGITPQRLPTEPLNAIVSLNWSFLVEQFELRSFLDVYRSHLTAEGLIVIDVIDAAYNRVPKNQYLTSDWNKPAEERQPSEYRVRYSAEQVHQIAGQLGMQVVDRISKPQTVPKSVYFLKCA